LATNFVPLFWDFIVVAIMTRQEDKIKTEMECKKADAIVLTYACDRPSTLQRLSSYWLLELRRLEVRVFS